MSLAAVGRPQTDFLGLPVGEPLNRQDATQRMARVERRSPARRILLFSDVHANWKALSVVLAHAAGKYDHAWFLGDMLGYGPHAVECLSCLKDQIAPRGSWLAGNHEAGIVDLKSSAAGVHRPSQHAADTWAAQRDLLLGEDRGLWDWLLAAVNERRTRPQKRDYGLGRQVFAHAHPTPGCETYLFAGDCMNQDHALRGLPGGDAPTWVVVGHAHQTYLAHSTPGPELPRLQKIQFGEPIRVAYGRYLIAPGSVGQPRDGDPRAAYAVLNTTTQEVTFYRVEYDYFSVAADMARLGFHQRLVDLLMTAKARETLGYDQVYQRSPDRSALIPIHHPD